MGSQAATTSQPVQVTAKTATNDPAPVAVKPVTVAELTPPEQALPGLRRRPAHGPGQRRRRDQGRPAASRTSPQAKTDWLAAQLDWERVGASYDSFGDLGLAVDGLPDGFAKGVNDPGFTGLHRLEYGLWHGQPAAELLPVADALAQERRHRRRRT